MSDEVLVRYTLPGSNETYELIFDFSKYFRNDKFSLLSTSQWAVLNTVYKYMFPFLCVLSISANVFTINVLKQLGFKEPIELLITSMAVSDIIYPITTLVEHIAVLVKDFDVVWSGYFGLAYKLMLYHWEQRAWQFSLYQMALFSLERVITLCSPSLSSRIFRAYTMKCFIGILLAMVIILTLPELYLFYDHVIQQNRLHKSRTIFYTYSPVVYRSVEVMCMVLLVLLPFAIIYLSSVVIFLSVPIVYSRASRIALVSRSPKDVKKLQLFKTLLLVFAAKFTSLTPLTIQLFFPFALLKVKLSQESHNFIDTIAKMSYVIFSGTNFFVYVVMNSKFTAAFRGLFFRQNKI